jgi:predicted branched-subunit amino acid permease
LSAESPSTTYPRGAASPRAAFLAGLRDAISSPALVSCASYVGLGSLLHELGLSAELGFASTALIWALPAQVASIEMYALGIPLATILIAVLLINFRFLPMVVSLMPLFRAGGIHRAGQYALAHFVSATPWILTMFRGPEMPPSQRAPYFLGCALTLIASSLIGIQLGYVVAGAVPEAVSYGLVFLNPLFFMLLMFIDLRQRLRLFALVLGAAMGPALHLLTPTWGLLIAGTAAGTAAFLLDHYLPGKRSA